MVRVTQRVDDTYRVGRAGADASHDGDEDVLLDGERARVELHAEDGPPWERPGCEAADGVRDELGDELADDDRGIAEEEELVHAGEDDGADDADDPDAQGARGHGDVVGVGDGAAHFRVRRVLLDVFRIRVQVGVVKVLEQRGQYLRRPLYGEERTA